MKQKAMRLAVLAVLSGALLAGPGTSRAGTVEAEAAYDKQDYFLAFRESLEPAKKGEAAAQAMVGRTYFEGKGAPRDFSTAFTWYRKAAEQGHAAAQFELARLYANGNGTKADPVLSAQWMEKSATQGVLWAMVALGDAYRKGTGVAADPAKAFQWMSIAAAAAETPATAEAIKQAKAAVAELQPKLDAAQLQAAQKQIAQWQSSKGPRDTLWMRNVNAPLPTVKSGPVMPKPEPPPGSPNLLGKDYFPPKQ